MRSGLSDKAIIDAEFADQWARTIEKGDVVRAPSGLLRVVRSVSRPSGRLSHGTLYARRTHVHFVIRHCSWTHRCYTTYNVGELTQIGYRPTKAKHVGSAAEAIIEEVMAAHSNALTCCDVEEFA